MPLGDSITGTTCYPQLLSQQFKTNNHTNFQFVGTVTNNQSCSGAPNVVSEGHGGYFVTYLLTNSPPASGKGTLTELQTWAAEKPDIVLMHYGTNDVWSNLAPATILAAYVSVINEFRKQNASVIFLVSKIIPMNPSGCSACGSRVVSLDALITDAWASTNSTASSPIYIVDQWTGFDATADTSDGVHPNLTGSQKMAAKAYAAVVSHGWF
jgi:lysophospholipase L1-like esterase